MGAVAVALALPGPRWFVLAALGVLSFIACVIWEMALARGRRAAERLARERTGPPTSVVQRLDIAQAVKLSDANVTFIKSAPSRKAQAEVYAALSRLLAVMPPEKRQQLRVALAEKRQRETQVLEEMLAATERQQG